MSDGRAKNNRHSQRAKNPQTNVAYRCAASHQRPAIWKFAQENPANPLKLSCLLKMHQRSIDLPRLHAPILKQQNRSPPLQFPRSPQSCLYQRQATAQNTSFRFAANQRLSSQLQPPATVRFSHRGKQRLPVIPFLYAFPRVQPCSQHRPIKSNPCVTLPKIGLQRSQIAITQNNFW